MGTGVLYTITTVAGLIGHNKVINTDNNRASRLSAFSNCSVCTADTNEWLWATFKVIKTWAASGCFSPLSSYSTNTHTHTQARLYPFSIWFGIHIQRGFINSSQKESKYLASQSQARNIERVSGDFAQPQPEWLAWIQKYKASITTKWSNVKYIHSLI